MNWREFITDTFESGRQMPGVAARPKFYPGASAHEIAKAAAGLNAEFPASLRSVLRESNGVMEMIKMDGGRWHNGGWVLWTLREIVKRNLYYRANAARRTCDRDFRKLVFFADAYCDGILFGFPIIKDAICAPRVMVWHPIEDEWEQIAPSLRAFLKGWLTGRISI